VALKGNFTMTAGILLDGYTVLDMTGSKLNQGDSMNADMITIVENAQHVDIIGGWIEGDKDTNDAGHGIVGSSYSGQVHITGVRIRYMSECGIRIGSAGLGLYFVSDCVITSNDEHGIFTSSFSDSFIYDNDIGANGQNGLFMGSSGANRISNNGFWLNNQDGGNAGLYLYECRRNVADGNIFHDNYRGGLEISGTSEGFNELNTVIGNLFYDNGKLSANSYYDLKLSGQYTMYNTITGNIFDSPDAKYNVFFTGPNPYPTQNVISSNVFKNWTTLQMAASGTFINNLVESNAGFVTENSGLINAATTPISVAHGLYLNPNSVVVTPSGSMAGNFSVSGIDATHFLINFDSGGSRAFYWYAERKP